MFKVGQRSDVIVKATGKPREVYWMRSHLTAGQCTEPSSQPDALGVIYYELANTNALPGNFSTPHVDSTPPCENDDLSLTQPSHPISAGEATTTIEMAVNVSINATGHLTWTINDSRFYADYNNPILLLAKQGKTSYPAHPEWNVYDVGTNATVRVVINNISPTSHPWHLHGHEMYAPLLHGVTPERSLTY